VHLLLVVGFDVGDAVGASRVGDRSVGDDGAVAERFSL
jgi:hypothetical protein